MIIYTQRLNIETEVRFTMVEKLNYYWQMVKQEMSLYNNGDM